MKSVLIAVYCLHLARFFFLIFIILCIHLKRFCYELFLFVFPCLQILCIHLKRFRHEFFSSKISSYISFPLHGLEMKPYLHKGKKAWPRVETAYRKVRQHGLEVNPYTKVRQCQTVLRQVYLQKSVCIQFSSLNMTP